MENGLSTEVETEQKEENTPQTPQQTSPPSLACRSLEKCNSCTNSISPMNEPAARERVRNNNLREKRKKDRRTDHELKRAKRRKQKMEQRKRGKERKPARKINQRGDVVNAARGSPHPRREDRTRLPKCRGLLTDDADIQRRRQRPPPHLSFHFLRSIRAAPL